MTEPPLCEHRCRALVLLCNFQKEPTISLPLLTCPNIVSIRSQFRGGKGRRERVTNQAREREQSQKVQYPVRNLPHCVINIITPFSTLLK